MKIEIKVPAMGESITEATVGKILKPNGAQVETDDEVLELETDKVNQLLYAPQAGVITWSVKSEETVKIGQVIGYLDSEAQSIRKGKESFIAELAVEEKKPLPKVVVQGKRSETRQKMSRIRKVIATKLVESLHSSAMLTSFNEVDLSEVIAIRERFKESFQKTNGVKIGFMSFFVKASVSALKAFPQLNSYIDGEDIVHREYFDIGVAVSTDRGLMVPVVRNCEQLSFAAIERSIEDFAKKARDGTVAVDDLQGGGFTVTNGGVFGSLLSTPILNPPQCGILGMHKIEKRAVVVNDQIVIRPMMYLALSYDHRIVDGKEAVAFLIHVKNCLEDPARLLLEG